MFPQVNPLPSAKFPSPIAQWHAQVDRRERRTDMGWHIVCAFARVDEQRIAVGHESFEKVLQIRADIGIGVFLDQQRRRGVLEMQRDQSVLKSFPSDPRVDFLGELVQTAASRREGQFMKALPQHELLGRSFLLLKQFLDVGILRVTCREGFLIMEAREWNVWGRFRRIEHR